MNFAWIFVKWKLSQLLIPNEILNTFKGKNSSLKVEIHNHLISKWGQFSFYDLQCLQRRVSFGAWLKEYLYVSHESMGTEIPLTCKTKQKRDSIRKKKQLQAASDQYTE